MREIPITQGYVAIIDDKDYDLVSQYRWYVLHSQNRKRQYAITSVGGRNNKRRYSMHRLILQPPITSHVDHVNLNGLDNRRCNLRLASFTNNMRNREARSKYGYKGVQLVAGKYWSATIMADRKRHYLGCFKTVEEAAKAYNEAAIRFHGEFAWLNKV